MVTTAPLNTSLRADVDVRPLRPPVVSAVALGALGLVLSATGSWIPSFWGDEVTSVLSATRSLPSLFRMLGHVDAVHGTYYVFLHFWVGVFGASPFSVRFPSAIAVGVMVAGVVFLGNRLGGIRLGVIAGMVAVILPRATYMGEEARAYAMSAALAVWVTLLLVKLVSDLAPSRRLWILYGVGVALCGYLFLFGLLLLVSHAVLVLTQRRRRLARSWIASIGLTLVLTLPLIAAGVAQLDQVAFRAHRSSATASDIWVSQWFQNDTEAIVCWALILLAIAVPLFLSRSVRPRLLDRLFTRHANGHQHSMSLLVTWLLAPTLLLLLVNAVHPIYSSRYLSFCVPAVALVVASLIARVRKNWLAALLVVALAAGAAPSYVHDRTPYAKNGSDWAADAAFLQANAHVGDGVIFDESTTPSKDPRLAMSGYPAAFAGLSDIEIKKPWYETRGWHDSVYSLADVTDRLAGVGTVWVVEYRAAGATADNYDLAELNELGYAVTATYSEHRSVVLELNRD